MDEKAKRFMRGESKNARAEELLALLKAEREINRIETTDVPNTLKKHPLLPAIRATSRNVDSSHSDISSFHKIKSRFLREGLSWEGPHGNDKNEYKNVGSFMKQKEYQCHPYENTSKNLPPLKTRRHSQAIVRPRCPEPQDTL